MGRLGHGYIQPEGIAHDGGNRPAERLLRRAGADGKDRHGSKTAARETQADRADGGYADHGVPHGQPAGTPPTRTRADGIGTDNDSEGTHRTGRGKETGRAVRPVPQEKERREEMRTALAEQEQAFSHLSDSLKIRNSILNRNLSRLIREIGQDETERMKERHMRVAELRETAFVLICGISAAGVLCVVLLYAVVRRDIRRRTRDRKQREELIENEELIKSRQNIMQTVTHDLRSPLTAIRGNAELILKDGNREATELHAEHIRQSAERMGALMENLLDYYRIDNGKETTA